MAEKFPLSPHFREYVYDILYNMPEDRRFSLKGKYYRIGRSNFYAKRFCDTAKLDEMIYVLNLLDVNWFLVFFNHRNGERYINNIFQRSKTGDKNADLNQAVQKQIYVSGSKQLYQILNGYSLSMQTGVYVNHLELSKAGAQIRGWSKKADTKTIREGIHSLETLNYLTETIVNSATACRRGDIPENQMWILTFLYRYAHTYLPYQRIVERFEGIIQVRNISGSVTKLKKAHYIDQSQKEKSFTITSLGVSTVHKIVGNVLKENSF